MNVTWSRVFARTGYLVGGGVVLGFIGLVLFFWTCVSFVDNYELGFVYDRMTGKIETINHTGWVVRMPIRYNIHSIDLRPYQISISANQRVLNAKLVRFNPEALSTFVEWHGRSAGDNLYNLLEILKCYAFDRDGGKDCPFLVIVSEIAPGQTATSSPMERGGK